MACPICQRQSDPRYRPFCSRRCADVDLGRWLTGGYAIPAEDEGAEKPDPDAPPRPH
ncbi:MAG: DNA gyrase inhibitor YacG [Paracoccaceae bacterium]